jgi:hypothetical protein
VTVAADVDEARGEVEPAPEDQDALGGVGEIKHVLVHRFVLSAARIGRKNKTAATETLPDRTGPDGILWPPCQQILRPPLDANSWRSVALVKYSAIVVPDFQMRNFKGLRKAAAIRRLPNAIKSLNLKATIKNAPDGQSGAVRVQII